ncbi:MAG: Eco57I restriction-modification methylase domain-containing protein [Synergistaceae bacterium]|jgi:hypothetical protein|nr:Eco57I restriction-modification methylase domain-containing protein [Synergistaceae bacterium]MDD3751081.1 TaqI-like C-terminal specificity domain-containing protein [Tissierellia bacterium]
MELQDLKPRKVLNKAFLKVKPNRTEIEIFKSNLIKLLGKIDEIEREENQKNHLRDFLRDTYYKENHEINTKDTKDLVIHHGKTNKTDVGVIIEAKRPSNKSEMIKIDEINKRAFHELILYYLRERITEKNINVKHLIISNVYEWFIFDENIFERIFAQNKKLVKQFQDFEASSKTTDVFYKEIAEPFVSEIKHKIEFAYFDIREYEKPLRNDDKKDDNKLIALFKLLSPEHLLKLPFTNDSNSLDKRFYGELLHIIGLTETKDGSKKIIERNKEGERNTGSFLENAIIQLDSLDKISRLENPSQFGATLQERLFSVGLELSITWINRILFLKLLEAQLVTYHKGDKSFEFLSTEKIKDYDDLNSLFFQVLARKQNERNEDVKTSFSKVPYLNSSLFEPTDIEHSTLFISQLRNDKAIPLYSQTVLKDDKGKKRTGELNPLEYLFAFLNAYDFTSEGSEEIQEDNKTLINASVLGLIFEKINGYKDGSFFTPGFITMYMCRETIRKSVIQKFNETKGWNCTDINSLYDKIDDQSEANKIVNDIKICDPAVGSGHFLVSALNEMIAIKSDLKILQDRESRRLKEYHFEVVNDELIVTDEDGELFEYNPTNKESQRIQETLFHEKQTIIENCLFGVDINPNSVKICRLRLWIELLKNAYYKNETELETLPNIDINIKCGNSLISRFSIDSDLSKALKSSKWSIDSYRIAVDTYRNAQSKEQKHEMEKLIATIKSNFKTNIDNPFKKKISNARAKVDKIAFNINTQKQWGEKINKKIFSDLEKATKNLRKLEEERDSIEANIIYENAFEWRFEFPEVLDDNGDFIGFDIIIGNPPYGVSIKGNERKHLVENVSKVPDYEIYYWFIDRSFSILKEKGISSYIIPNSILFNVFAQNYRLSLFDKWNIEELLDCTEFDIFEDATVRNVIFQFIKNDLACQLSYKPTNEISSFEELSLRERITIDKSIAETNNQNWGLVFKLSNNVLGLIQKIKTSHILSDNYDATQGYIPYRKSDLIKIYGKEKAESIVKNREWHSNSKVNEEYKEEIFGESIGKFNYKKTGSYVWYGKHLATYVDPKYFNQKRLLIREITNPGIIACIVEEEFVNDPQIISVIQKNELFPVEYLWAILNSKLATFYHFNSSPKATKGAFPKILVYDVNNFPLPKDISEADKESIVKIANEILTKKHADCDFDSSELEEQIDRIIYKMYELSTDDIELIENTLI